VKVADNEKTGKLRIVGKPHMTLKKVDLWENIT
jgi:hypothetical protein